MAILKRSFSFRSIVFLFTISIIFSCSEEENPIVEELSFTVNGQTVSYTNPNAGLNFFEQLAVSGSTDSSEEEITVMLLNNSKGSFTQDDIDDTQSFLDSNYDINYTDENGNFYFYNESFEGSNFLITIDEFSPNEGGLVSGSFRGVLFGILIDETATRSVEISNGKFTVKRKNASLDNLY